MKLFSVVLCVGMLCITTASKGLQHSHHLKKRQDGSDDTCNIGTLNNICTSGYQQGYATVSLECNQRFLAVSIQEGCQTSESGTPCGAVDTYEINLNINTVCGRSPTSCTSDCRDLLTTTRAQLGCCITGFNNTFARQYFYSLWSLCGVETLTEECAPSPVVLPTNPVIDYDCTQDILVERLYDQVLCRTQYLDSLRDATAEFCGDVSYDIYSTCDVDNQTNRYCDNFQSDEVMSNIRQAASDNCADTSICAHSV